MLVQMDEGRNDVFGTEYAFVTEHASWRASWRGCSLFFICDGIILRYARRVVIATRSPAPWDSISAMGP